MGAVFGQSKLWLESYIHLQMILFYGAIDDGVSIQFNLDGLVSKNKD